MNNNLNNKTDAAIIFLVKKFKKEKIPFGILKIQRFLGYVQILSGYEDKKFIFEKLKFELGKYGPLNLDSGKKGRVFLNPTNLQNNHNGKKEIERKGNIDDLTEKDKRKLNLIFKKKKNTNIGEFFGETHYQEPCIQARMKNNATKIATKGFSELEITKISNKSIQTSSEKIVKNYIFNNENSRK